MLLALSRQALTTASLHGDHDWQHASRGQQVGGWCHSGSGLLQEWPDWRVHWLSGGRPSDKLIWLSSLLWAGTLAVSQATRPKITSRQWLMVSEIDGRPVVAEIASFRMNRCHLICSNCLWHFMQKSTWARESTEKMARFSMRIIGPSTDCIGLRWHYRYSTSDQRSEGCGFGAY